MRELKVLEFTDEEVIMLRDTTGQHFTPGRPYAIDENYRGWFQRFLPNGHKYHDGNWSESMVAQFIEFRDKLLRMID